MANEFCYINDPIINIKIDSNTPRETVDIYGGVALRAVVNVNLADIDGKTIYVTVDLTDPDIADLGEVSGSCLMINGSPLSINKKPQFTVINGIVNTRGIFPGDIDFSTELWLGGSYQFVTQEYSSPFDGWTGTEVYKEPWAEVPRGRVSGCSIISLVNADNELYLSPRLS